MRNLVFVWWLGDGEALFMYYEEITGEWVLMRMNVQESDFDNGNLANFDTIGFDAENETQGVELKQDKFLGSVISYAEAMSNKHSPDAVYEMVSICQADYNVSLN